MFARGARRLPPETSQETVWGWGPLAGKEMWGDRATLIIDHICIFGFPGCAAAGLSRADLMRSAMSALEMAKRFGSTGAASGGSPTRRRSHSRNSCRSSRSAARQPAWKNRSRCAGLSRAHPCMVRSNRSPRTKPRSSRCFASRTDMLEISRRCRACFLTIRLRWCATLIPGASWR